MNPDKEHVMRARGPEEFATTCWSVVLRAGKRGDRQAEEALAWLCEQYWFPLYAYVRRRTTDVNEAQDLTQGFFTRLLEKNVLAHGRALTCCGRFRSFLLTSLKNFLSNERDRADAQKRGGRCERLALDLQSCEPRIRLEPAYDLTPGAASLNGNGL